MRNGEGAQDTVEATRRERVWAFNEILNEEAFQGKEREGWEIGDKFSWNG